jgi:hypothetical protein
MADTKLIQEFGDAQEYLIRIPASSGTLEETSKRVEQAVKEAGLRVMRCADSSSSGRRSAGTSSRRRSTRSWRAWWES